MDTPSGGTTTINRDELGRPYKVVASDANTTTESFATYDDATANALGRLYATRDDSGDLTRVYDAAGFPEAIHYDVSSAVRKGQSDIATTYTAWFDYDRHGNLDSLSFDGLGGGLAELEYLRDGLGRVDEVLSHADAGTATIASNIAFDEFGAVTAAELGNGTSATWSYAPYRHLLERVEHLATDGLELGRVEYDYDANGNVTWETRYRDSADDDDYLSLKAHTYDGLDRLDQTMIHLPSDPAYSEVYEYSPGGNIDTAAGEDYSYNEEALPEAVTYLDRGTGDFRDLQYDADGRMVSSTDKRPTSQGHIDTQTDVTYDAAGCMRDIGMHAKDQDGQTVAEKTTSHVCGQDGRRVLRETVDWETGETERVIDFAGMAEIRPDDGIMLWRVPVNEAVVAEEARSLTDGSTVEAESGYLHTDVRGSVLAKTAFSAPASLPFEEAEYGPWGQTLQVDTSDAPRHQFVGFEPDPATGWYFMGARVYDPSLRRWLSPDPLMWALPDRDTFIGGQLNLYSYTANNPTSNLDPFGFEKYTVHMRSFAPFKSFGGGFEGDNRGFSTSSSASSRMFGEVQVDTDNGTVSEIVKDSSGTTWITGPGKKAAIQSSLTSTKSSKTAHGVVYALAGSNPMVPGSPDIDLKTAMSVSHDKENGVLRVGGNMSGDQFPNAELFVEDEAGNRVFVSGYATEGGAVTGPARYLPGEGDEDMGSYSLSIGLDEDGNFNSVEDSDGNEYTVDEWNDKWEGQGRAE